MHPIVARIHPSFRTAFFAWLIARAAVWVGTQVRLGRVFGDLSVSVGTPMYRNLTELLDFSGFSWAPAGLALVGEALLLAGVVGVYRFARREGIPQAADRAAWLWIASPAMLFATPGSDWTYAYALCALAFASQATLLPSSIVLALAVCFRAEAVLVFPGLAWLWWKQRDKSTDPALSLLATALAPAAFAFTVLGGLLFSDPGEMLAPKLRWRTGLEWNGLESHLSELFVVGLLFAALLVVARTTQATNRSWLLITIPVLLFAAITVPPVAGAALLPLAIPLSVQLAKFAHDPALERVLLGSSLVALALGFPPWL